MKEIWEGSMKDSWEISLKKSLMDLRKNAEGISKWISGERTTRMLDKIPEKSVKESEEETLEKSMKDSWEESLKESRV